MAKPSFRQSHVGASRLGAAATGEATRSRRLRRCPQSLSSSSKCSLSAARMTLRRSPSTAGATASTSPLPRSRSLSTMHCGPGSASSYRRRTGPARVVAGQGSAASAFHRSRLLRLCAAASRHRVRPNPSLKRDCHRQGSWPARRSLSIIRLAGQAPSRRQPLSSNVRRHRATISLIDRQAYQGTYGLADIHVQAH